MCWCNHFKNKKRVFKHKKILHAFQKWGLNLIVNLRIRYYELSLKTLSRFALLRLISRLFEEMNWSRIHKLQSVSGLYFSNHLIFIYWGTKWRAHTSIFLPEKPFHQFFHHHWCSAWKQVLAIQFLQHSLSMARRLIFSNVSSVLVSSSIMIRGFPIPLFPSIRPSITFLTRRVQEVSKLPFFPF